jgi:hypothetical protein
MIGGMNVLLFIKFVVRCDEFLWGSLLSCGGLVIRLPALWFAARRNAGQVANLRIGNPPFEVPRDAVGV